jgi:adenosylcobinamide-GDP ribazoletransferase
MAGARSALAFLTPIGGARTPSGRAVAWFPVVGAAVGAALGLLWWAGSKAWPAAAIAAIVVAADLLLTGMLHLDGVVDTADGLLAHHVDTGRRLDLMREPTIGAFGVGAAGAGLLLRWAAFFALRPSVLLVTGIWCAARTLMAVVPSRVPYARAPHGGGLASGFFPATGRGPVAALVVGLAGSLSAVMLWRPLGGAVSLSCGVLAAAGLVVLARRRLGGYTGDVLGAAGFVLETVSLLVASARW